MRMIRACKRRIREREKDCPKFNMRVLSSWKPVAFYIESLRMFFFRMRRLGYLQRIFENTVDTVLWMNDFISKV